MKSVPILLLIILLSSCGEKSSDQQESSSNLSSYIQPDFSMENLLAWCIVPFDALERSPEERISMLSDLGFTRYAYDWREKHLDEMAREIKLARKNNIDMMAVWMWIDANSDSVGFLSPANQKLLDIIRQTGLKTQIWLGINANFFEGLDETQKIRKGTAMVKFLEEETTKLDCKLALYNHGDWFGNPINQIHIIEKLPDSDIGIIYNFHHAHEQIENLDVLIDAMKEYLWVVNLNGMKKEGPKILTIGKGDHEKKMIQKFLKAGFDGPWGILGHVEERDVKEVLEENLKGLKTLFP